MISEYDILLRVAVAAFLGFVIGFERERQDHSAGLRTHMILVVGAALAMPLSINVAVQYASLAPGGDPGRLASQVISGIGFLGAGVIFRYGINVRGLTTAASLWTVAVIGLTAGAGLFTAASVTTVVLFFILSVINSVEDRWISTYERLRLTVWAQDRVGLVGDIRNILNQKKHKIGTVGIEKDFEDHRVILDIYVRIFREDDPEVLLSQLGNITGIYRVKISE